MPNKRVTVRSMAYIRLGIAVAVSTVVIFSPLLCSVAEAKEPTGIFAAFEQCPRFTPTVNFCIYSRITGGEAVMGSFRMSIENPVILQGGYYRNEEHEPVVESFFPAINGQTMSKSPQPVPGGLLGILTPAALPKVLGDSFQKLAEQGGTGVIATIELAEPAGDIGLSTDNIVNEEGIGMSLPIKVHLQSPFLGSNCYIGSSTSPLTVNLTDSRTNPPAPNKPINGHLGDLDSRAVNGLTYDSIIGNTMVDNSFSLPTANGCGGGYSPVVDRVIDTKLGLPSPAGHNSITLISSDYLATAEDVIAAEK